MYYAGILSDCSEETSDKYHLDNIERSFRRRLPDVQTTYTDINDSTRILY